ncbi:Transcription elongation factor SPT5 [Spathaspora sp. JA1]|nr:Transcription elongation factor SPT5 [Spathaspora sp. JA1]
MSETDNVKQESSEKVDEQVAEQDLTFDEEFRRADEEGEEEQQQEELKRTRDEEEDNDEDDEDDEEEDEDEEEVTRKRKRRRGGANQFIDIEAEVDDEEEDELDEDDEEAELLRQQFITEDHPDDGDISSKDHVDDRLHRQYDRRRQEAEDQDAEQLAETLKQRYRKTHTMYRGETAASGTVSQKLLMPSINDPSIYAIRCTPGREKELVRKLYEKKRTLDRSNHPLDILTVFQRDSFRGYLYIEAKRPDAIDKALSGMVNVYIRDKLLVPVKEYPDLLKQVKSTDVELVPGIYVRITRGKYKGDLAIVDNLSENGLDVRCKLVPRLDYGRNDEVDVTGRKIKSKVRPLPRLFNEQEAKMYDNVGLIHRGARNYIYKNDEYIDGFLYKDFKLQFIQTKDVHPSLEELDRFQNDEEGLDLSAISSLKNKQTNSQFQPGDKVEIRRGEQAKTVGIVIETSINEIIISVIDSGDVNFINQKLTVPANDLRKIFHEGDHVRIIEGKHFDETGLVIKIDGDSVIVVSDQTKSDVRVFANYLVKATDATTSSNVLDNAYDIKDLVELNASTVGVIIKADKNIFEILTSDGRILPVKPSGISSKLTFNRRDQQIATDRNGSQIKIGDTVRDEIKNREGVILHIYKNSLFIKSNEIIENLGIFVTNRMNVQTITTKDSIMSKNLGPDLNSMNPNLKLPALPASSGFKSFGRDKLIYKDVAVTSGSYKGLKGKVTDTDDVYARIELHTKSKKIKVPKNNLNVMIRGEAIPYLRFIGANTQQAPPSYNQPKAPAFSSGSAWGGAGAGSAAAGSAWGGAGAGAGGAGSTWGGATAAPGSTWGGGKTPASSNSTWGGNNTGSTWGGNSAGNSNSTWGGGKTPGNNSTWGNKKGNGSTWGGNNSTWGN